MIEQVIDAVDGRKICNDCGELVENNPFLTNSGSVYTTCLECFSIRITREYMAYKDLAESNSEGIS